MQAAEEASHCTRMPRRAQAAGGAFDGNPGVSSRWRGADTAAISLQINDNAAFKMALKDIEAIDHSLELDEAHWLHVWIWRLQYVFIALVIVIAALSMAGLFGGGWLSRTEAYSDGASIVYQRFMRYGNETVLEATLPTGNGSIAIPLEYFGRFKLNTVVPQPEAQRIQGSRILFEFNATGASVVRFHLLPLESGTSEADIGVGNASFTVSQLTWP